MPITTTVMNMNTVITTITTIPSHIDTAALKTITASEPLNQATDTRHITIMPTPVSACTEVKLTTDNATATVKQ